MNKAAIKSFAIEARNLLIQEVKTRAGLYGITAKGIAKPLSSSTGNMHLYDVGLPQPFRVEGEAIAMREKLAEAIHAKAKTVPFAEAFDLVMQEVAYTWFNRLIAVRFMEVNDYLPGHVRVLSSPDGYDEPEIVTQPYSSDLEFTDREKDYIRACKEKTNQDELFRFLFIKQCNALSDSLPLMFEKINDYTELLLNISFKEKQGVVYKLVHDIPESNFHVEQEGQIEIIGWMYQYYNTEPKSIAQKKKAISKSDIPAVTQLFTPDWIVRYMVENSLGRLYVNAKLKEETFATEADRKAREQRLAREMGWSYYLPEAEQAPEVRQQLAAVQQAAEYDPEQIRFVDPCMGSGHILVYAFEVMFRLYTEAGYTARNAVRNILEKNLYGLDIDDRAGQLAYFAVMMAGRRHDAGLLRRGIKPHVTAMQESKPYTADTFNLLGSAKPLAERLMDDFADGKEIGSLTTPQLTAANLDELEAALYRVRWIAEAGDSFMERSEAKDVLEHIQPLLEQCRILAQKYDCVITNPPYMAPVGKVKAFVEKHYPEGKADLYAVFIQRNLGLAVQNGFVAMITMHSWMFLSSFEKLRKNLQGADTLNMAHLGARAFEEIGGEVVQTTAFVLAKRHTPAYTGTYCRLIEPNTQQGKEEMYLAGENRYTAQQSNFEKIPGSPVAYWATDNILKPFSMDTSASKYADFRHGMSTSDNTKYLRLWFEPAFVNIGFAAESKKDTANAKWYIYLKGGSFRRWYGNFDYVVNWKNDGQEIKEISNIKYPYLKGNLDFVLGGQIYFFKPGYTWSSLTSGLLGIRKFGKGCIFDAKGQSYFPTTESIGDYLSAFFNSSVFAKYGEFLSPTLDFNSGVISKAPVIINKERIPKVVELVNANVSLSKRDWDSFETSWDFEQHPLV